MPKQLFIYDVNDSLQDMFAQRGDDMLPFSASPAVKNCLGCFGCWIKTPGQCVIPDRCQVIPSYIAQCSEVIILSPIFCGGYSQKVKAVLDRSIGYILPYFRIVNKEMHHQMRYENPFRLSVHFYGECDEKERETARRLVKANAVNLGAGDYSVDFYDTAEDAGRTLL